MLWRARAWPTTASPTSAASAARIHHPTAWGWIDAWIVAAVPSSLEAPTLPTPRFSRLTCVVELGNAGRTVAEADEVLVLQRRMREHRARANAGAAYRR